MIATCTPIKSGGQIETYYVDERQKGTADDYYVNKLEVHDHFGGQLADELHLDPNGQIDKDVFKSITKENTERLTKVMRKGETPTLGADITFSAQKSVSLAIGTESPEISAEIDRLFCESVDETLKEDIEPNFIAKNISQQKLREGIERELTGNALYSTHNHYLSRAEDLDRHTHTFLQNMTIDSNGKISTIDILHLMQNQKVFGALCESRFFKKLQEAGYELREGKSGYELAGYSDEVIERASQRRADMDKYLDEHGLDKTPENYQKANLATRKAKNKNADLESIKDETKRICKEENAHVIKHNHSIFAEASDGVKREIMERALTNIQEKSFAFSVEDLRLAILDEGKLHGLTFKNVESMIRNSKELKYLGQRTDIKTDPDRSTKEITTQFFTTKANLRLKDSLRKLNEDQRGKGISYSSKKIDEAIQNVKDRTGMTPNEEQEAFVKNFLASPDRCYVLNGKPGTGKTYSMLMLRNTLKELGVSDDQISGAAFQKAAAIELAEDTKDKTIPGDEGIKTTTLDSLLLKKEIESLRNKNTPKDHYPDFENHGRKYDFSGLQKLTKPEYLIVDEAGMVDDVKLKGIMDYAKAVSTEKAPLTILFSGDYNQIQSIQLGGFYRNCADHNNGRTPAMAASYLENIQRQKDRELKSIVESIVNDDSVEKSFQLLHERTLKNVRKQIAAEQDLKKIVVKTESKEIAKVLTDDIRQKLIVNGELKNEHCYQLQGKAKDGKTSFESFRLAEGDQITLTRKFREAVKNENITVDSIEGSKVKGHTETGEICNFNMEKVRSGVIHHSYVTTDQKEAERLAKEKGSEIIEAHGGIREAKTDIEKEEIATREFFRIHNNKENPQSVAVCVETNDQRQRMNQRIRNQLIKQGEVEKESVKIKVDNGQQEFFKNGRRNKNFKSQEIEIAQGDRLICLKNDNRKLEKGGTGTYNNLEGTVTSINKDGLMKLKTDDGKIYDVDLKDTKAWDYAYSKTVNKLQGATKDVLIGIEGRANRNAHFVAVSRARHEAVIITSNAARLEKAAGKWAENVEEQSFAPVTERGSYKSPIERAAQFRRDREPNQIQIGRIREHEMQLGRSRNIDDVPSHNIDQSITQERTHIRSIRPMRQIQGVRIIRPEIKTQETKDPMHVDSEIVQTISR